MRHRRSGSGGEVSRLRESCKAGEVYSADQALTSPGVSSQGLRRYWSAVVAVMVGALVLAACSSTTTTTKPSKAVSKKGPVILGLATPLTGGDPTEGTSEVADFKDAVAYVNSHGGIDGRTLKLVVRDTDLSPTGAVTAFDSLVSAGAVAVTGEFTSSDTRAGCIPAMADHVVLLAGSSAAQGLTRGKTYCFRDEYQVNQSTGSMVLIAKREGWTKIGIGSDTSGFGLSELNAWSAALPANGITVAAKETWPMVPTSLTAQVLDFKHSGAQAIFVGAAGTPEVVLLAKTMLQEGLHIPLFGPGGVIGTGIAATAGPSYSRLPLVLGITSYDSQVPAEAALMAEISRQTGIPQFGGNMPRDYNGVLMLAAALRKTGGKGGIALVDALQALGKYPMPTAAGPGTYEQFTATHHSGLYGPNLISIYKWNSGTSSFAYSSKFSTLANTAPHCCTLP